MSHRFASLTLCAVAGAMACFAGTAAADPAAKTTITFSCDRTTAAYAHVELMDASGSVLWSDDLGCDPNTGVRSDRRVLGVDASYVVVGPYGITTPAGTTPCGGEGTLTFKLACTDESGAGATLVVR